MFRADQIIFQKEYCPPIDTSLFYALVSDYDLSSPESLLELRSTLDSLKVSALEEEDTTFDPSGSNAWRVHEDSDSLSGRPKSWHGDATSTSGSTGDTATTSISQGLDELDVSTNRGTGSAHDNHGREWDDLSQDARVESLNHIFPSLKKQDVAFVLKQSKNEYGRAVEELLNQSFLEEEVDDTGEKIIKRGVDGFTAPATRSRAKKKKKNAHLERRTSSTPAPMEDGTSDMQASSNRWDGAKEDIDYIASRTFLPRAVIASLYHKSGGSLPSTIATVCRQNDLPNPYVADASPTPLKTQTTECMAKIPTLLPSQASALVRLTYPSNASAQELARTLSRSVQRSGGTAIPGSGQERSSLDFSDISYTPVSTRSPFSPQQSTERLAASRSAAYGQASAAHRLSKSKPLMGGAAAYYSSVARDASAALRQRGFSEARALVASQSRPGEVDLHGVNVKDAVAIARQEVELWWEREAKEWAREGKVRNGGLRMITGRGQHSEGGKGRLGPAVGGMLVREGWKVEIGQGVIDVVGRKRT